MVYRRDPCLLKITQAAVLIARRYKLTERNKNPSSFQKNNKRRNFTFYSTLFCSKLWDSRFHRILNRGSPHPRIPNIPLGGRSVRSYYKMSHLVIHLGSEIVHWSTGTQWHSHAHDPSDETTTPLITRVVSSISTHPYHFKVGLGQRENTEMWATVVTKSSYCFGISRRRTRSPVATCYSVHRPN